MRTFDNLVFVFENGDEISFSVKDVSEYGVYGVVQHQFKAANSNLITVSGFDSAHIMLTASADRPHHLFGTCELAETEFRFLSRTTPSQIVLEKGSDSITYCLTDDQTVHTSVYDGNLVLDIK